MRSRASTGSIAWRVTGAAGYTNAMSEESGRKVDAEVEEGRKRLEDVEEHITEARQDAAEALQGPFHDDHTHAYYESGDEEGEQEDDQTIAKP